MAKDTADRAKSPDRRARLAAALKANIARRKAAAKEADGSAPAYPAAGSDGAGKPTPPTDADPAGDGGGGGGGGD